MKVRECETRTQERLGDIGPNQKIFVQSVLKDEQYEVPISLNTKRVFAIAFG